MFDKVIYVEENEFLGKLGQIGSEFVHSLQSLGRTGNHEMKYKQKWNLTKGPVRELNPGPLAP